jgi:exosortase/archaeosortase family protein
VDQDAPKPAETPPPDDAGRVATMFVVKLLGFALVLGFGEAYLKSIQWGLSFQEAVAAVAVGISRVFDSGIHREGNQITGAHAILIVSLECTAVYAKALFCSAAIAFPARWRERLIGCVIGIVGVAALNIFRLVVLILISRGAPQFFDFAHVVLLQWFLISCIAPLWLMWAVWATRREKASRA